MEGGVVDGSVVDGSVVDGRAGPWTGRAGAVRAGTVSCEPGGSGASTTRAIVPRKGEGAPRIST